ncbi:hypothetical protein ACE0DR_00355 [Azotobacter sp. CWF10]
MAKVAYLLESADGIYSGKALAWVADPLLAYAVINTSSILDISAGAVAGAMAEEGSAYYEDEFWQSLLDKYALSGVSPEEFMNDVRLYGWHNAFLVNQIKFISTFRTHAEISADYEWLKFNIDENGDPMLDAHDKLDKIKHPALIDLGPGNFKLATAIALLNNYLDSVSGDPLSLAHYAFDYAMLARDLADPNSNVVANLYGLMVKEAEQWFLTKQAYGENWVLLPQEFRDALYVTYVNFGRTLMEKKFDEFLASGDLVYEPLPGMGTGGGMNHLLNSEAIGTTLNDENYGYVVGAAHLEDFASLAKTDTVEGLAYRYALYKLRPVAIVGLNYYGIDLSVYDDGGDLGNITYAWINDRADMLRLKFGGGSENKSVYSDLSREEEIYGGDPENIDTAPQIFLVIPQVIHFLLRIKMTDYMAWGRRHANRLGRR